MFTYVVKQVDLGTRYINLGKPKPKQVNELKYKICRPI